MSASIKRRQRRGGRPQTRAVDIMIDPDFVREVDCIGVQFIDVIAQYDAIVGTAAEALGMHRVQAIDMLETYLDEGGHADGLFAWVANRLNEQGAPGNGRAGPQVVGGSPRKGSN